MVVRVDILTNAKVSKTTKLTIINRTNRDIERVTTICLLQLILGLGLLPAINPTEPAIAQCPIFIGYLVKEIAINPLQQNCDVFNTINYNF